VDVAVGVAVAVVDFELMSVEIKKTLGVLPGALGTFQKTLTVDETTLGAKFDILYR
jgi:hypothetical protein